MYKNKPLIIAERPWWRNPVFPWGWYSLVQDKIEKRSEYFADGHYKPGDGGGGRFYWDATYMETPDSGQVFEITEDKP